MFVNPDVAAEATGFPALGFNPAPGEPSAVGAGARQYSGIAEKLHHAHEAIQSIITQRGMWEGEASEAFTRRVGDLPEYLDAAAGSMNKAANALTQWADSLDGMRRTAEELERQAKKAKEELEAAEANPAFELANQWFDNAQALQSAQTALGNAATQVDSAANRLAEIMDAAERLQAQHRDIAEQVAATLDEARQLAPDEPGLVGKMLDGLSGLVTDYANFQIDSAQALQQTIYDFVEDNANVIGEVSGFAGDVSTMLGLAAEFVPGAPGKALGTASSVLGGVSTAGRLAAKAGGADIPTESFMFDVVGLGASGMPYGGGLFNAGFQAGAEVAARTQGEDAGTAWGRIPFGGRWWSDLDDASALDEAGQAERDQQRAQERVWK